MHVLVCMCWCVTVYVLMYNYADAIELLYVLVLLCTCKCVTALVEVKRPVHGLSYSPSLLLYCRYATSVVGCVVLPWLSVVSYCSLSVVLIAAVGCRDVLH